MRKKANIRTGFTLIELSIVLVIVGLIIGGVLVGRDLIIAATVRAQIKQMEDLETQINTFRGKYGCLPGDCTNATTFFGTPGGSTCPDGTTGNIDSTGATVCNGDGDGTIHSTLGGGGPYTDDNCLDPDLSGEITELFHHLSLAGFGHYNQKNLNFTFGSGASVGNEFPQAVSLNGVGTIVTCLASDNHPTAIPAFANSGNILVVGIAGAGGRIGYDIGSYGVEVYGGFGNDSAGTLSPIGIPVDFARQMDMKIDDGIPNSGRFGVVSGTISCGGNNYTAYPAPGSACVVTIGKKL